MSLRGAASVESVILPQWVGEPTVMGNQLMYSDLHHQHRRLEYYGGLNWIVIFLVSGFLFIYCCKYQFYPRYLRLYRHMYAKRLTAALDSIDEFEMMFEESKRTQQIDPETGELYWVEDRLAQLEIKPEVVNETEATEEVKTGDPLDRPVGGENELDSPVQSPKRKKVQKPLSPKKIAQLQQKKEEAEAYAEACRRAIYVPLREEKLRIVREAFEKQIESGNMGWQLSVEQKNSIGKRVVDGMQLRDPRSVKYFHDLTFADTMERGRPKRRHRQTSPKSKERRRSPSPKSKDALVGKSSKGIAAGKPVGLRTNRANSPDRSPSPPPLRRSISPMRPSTTPSGSRSKSKSAATPKRSDGVRTAHKSSTARSSTARSSASPRKARPAPVVHKEAADTDAAPDPEALQESAIDTAEYESLSLLPLPGASS